MNGFESQSEERVPEILMTASALAKAVGCHQTTISRAVSSGHLIPDFLITTATGRPMIGFRIDRHEEISAIIGHPACR